MQIKSCARIWVNCGIWICRALLTDLLRSVRVARTLLATSSGALVFGRNISENGRITYLLCLWLTLWHFGGEQVRCYDVLAYEGNVCQSLSFRSAVGDSLRAIYDNLSRDPNSLSNLDQDLPNYAQTMVPIFSLPQEWLWCESWCSNDSLATAKTVDLCNNPRYKEPKLSMAQRVVAGPLFSESWVELDAEIASAESKWRSTEM